MIKLHSRLIWVILIVLALFIGYLYWQSNQSNGNASGNSMPVAVSTGKAQIQPMIRSVSSLGTGLANNSIQLITPVSDFLTELNVNEGKLVKKGEIIARLHDVQKRARVTELKTVLADQSRQLDRLKNLATTQATAQSLLDEQQTKVNTTLAQLDIAKAQLAEMTIAAPFSGYLGLRQVSEGAYLNSGTVITTLDDLQTLRVAFSVAEHYLAELALGMPLSVTNVAYGNIPFHGTVTAIDTRLDPATRSITVHGSIANDSLQLRPGMLLQVKLELANRPVLQISEKALVPQQDKQYVFIVGENNTVKRTAVTIGQRIPGWVEVLSGLSEGDEIVTEGIQKIRDGSLINRIGG